MILYFVIWLVSRRDMFVCLALKVHIAYIPNKKVVGLSKLAR